MTTLADIQAVIQSIKNDDPTSISLLQYALALLTGYVENNPPGGGITQLTGDVTAGPGSGSQVASVAKIQGVAVSSTPPTAAGDILTWNGTSWAPATALWSKSGTELSPATAGDTVKVEIPFGTSGVTVADTGASFSTEIRPANVLLTDNSVKFAELNAATAKLRLEGDSAELPPVIPTIVANDAGGAPTTLDLQLNGLTVNGAPGNAGDVLTSGGAGVAPTWQPAAAGITELTGDVTAGPGSGSQAATVAALQGYEVSNVAPANGNVLAWSTAQNKWVPGSPASGGGSGGVVLYLNGSTAATAPTAGLPVPSNVPGTIVQELGTTVQTALATIESLDLTQAPGAYDLVASFVTPPNSPGVTTIPAGLWEFNIWASSTGTTSNQTVMQARVYKYDGATAPTLIATSDDVSIYDPTVIAQYILTVVIPAGVTLLATDRIYIELRARALQNNRRIIFNFGDGQPTHVTTTLPSAAGGDLSGTYPNPTVVALQGNPVSATAPSNGQVLAWSGAQWAPSSFAAYDQMIYVADGADAALANGSPVYPFASISAALASISDASPTKRYTILITAGEYTEAGAVNLKPNVFLCGVVPDAVRITAASWGLDATFTGGGDNRTGIHNCIVTGAVNLNFTTVTSTAGKFYARSTIFISAVTLTGYNNAIVQAQFSGCQFFGLVTVQGVNVGVANDNIHFNGLTLTQSPFSVPTIWAATGGTLGGTLTATTTVNDFNRRISLFCKSFWMGTVVIDGPSTYLDYTADSLPVAGATVLNGANLVLINPPTSVGADTALSNLVFPTAVNNPIIPATTNATNMGDWGKQWLFSFGYVHLSTGTELYLASAGTAATPDSAGRPIFIEADTYGLDTNVNGGDINITTQAGVSGTGTRGNVNINTREINLSLAGAMNVNAAPGNSGDVLTSQGAGAAPVWAAPASSSSRTYPINVSNNAGSTVWGPAVWLDSGFNPATSSARFYLPVAGDIGRLILSANRVTTVAEFTTASAPFAGVFDASFSAGVSVLSPGWYVFGVQNSSGSGNTVECLGIRLT